MKQKIDDLREEYAAWRLIKKNKNERIPKELQGKTLIVHNEFPDLNLRYILKLSPSSWKALMSKRGKIIAKKSNQTKNENKFIKLNTPDFLPPETKPLSITKSQQAALVMTINNIQITIYN